MFKILPLIVWVLFRAQIFCCSLMYTPSLLTIFSHIMFWIIYINWFFSPAKEANTFSRTATNVEAWWKTKAMGATAFFNWLNFITFIDLCVCGTGLQVLFSTPRVLGTESDSQIDNIALAIERKEWDNNRLFLNFNSSHKNISLKS